MTFIWWGDNFCFFATLYCSCLVLNVLLACPRYEGLQWRHDEIVTPCFDSFAIRQHSLYNNTSSQHRNAPGFNGKHLVNKRDLLAFYLSGTYYHKTDSRPLSCVTPRQPTTYVKMEIFGEAYLNKLWSSFETKAKSDLRGTKSSSLLQIYRDYLSFS